MIYNLHIGLPKTATTFWQMKVFPGLDSLIFLHNNSNVKSTQKLLFDLRHYCHKGYKSADGFSALLDRLQRFESCFPNKELLISSENMSLTSTGFWNEDGAGPEEVIERLKVLQAALGHPRFRVLFGTRNPESWYPSRYAESAKNFEDFCQSDFDRRIENLNNKGVVSKVSHWLNYNLVSKILNETFGNENVLTMSTENLEAEPALQVMQFGRFLSGRNLSGLVQTLVKNGEINQRLNSLTRGKPLQWKMRGDAGDLTVSEKQQRIIKETFSFREH